MATERNGGPGAARHGALRRTVATLVLAGIAVAFSLGLAEVSLRLLVPRPEHYAMLFPGTRIIEPDQRFIHGIEGPARYEVNPAGYRGRDLGPDSSEYRVLLVGGSTTECALLDLSENWGTIVERELTPTRDGRATWVGNVGRSGLTARDHAVTVKYLLPQYPRIDLVVVLVGVNDLTAALRQGDSYKQPPPITSPEAERVQVRNAFAISPEGLYQPLTAAAGEVSTPPWYESLRLYDLARRARSGGRASEMQRQLGGGNVDRWRTNRQQASRILEQLPDLTAPLTEYRTNLEAIVAGARQAGTDVVFLTQPTLWRVGLAPEEERLLWLGGTGSFQDQPGEEYYSVPALAEAMAQYNRTTMEVCQDHGLSCFDLAAAMAEDTVLLYDDVHFTESGSALVGQLVAAHLSATQPNVFAPQANPVSAATTQPNR